MNQENSQSAINIDEIKELATQDESTEKKDNKGKKSGSSLMQALVKQSPEPPEVGQLVEGPVIDIDRASVFVDLRPFGTGIIYGREFIQARDIIKKVNIGDTITAKVIERANEDGYIDLSLREARQAMIWDEAEQAITEKKVFELPVKEANKGGLLLEWQGIRGFLPASQLKEDHYPRVEDGDKDRIYEELKQLVGEKLPVTIITADPKEGKLIFSERESDEKGKEEIVAKYNVGDVLEGEVTGVVDFGVFVKVEDNLEGLVHISEIDWGLVEDPRAMFEIGQKVNVKVIEVKNGKISLSIKALKKNPWVEAAERYKQGQIVDGVVIKYNQYGALASIEEGVAGLVHISEFGTFDNLKQEMELGKTYKFRINLFEPDEQRMTLSLVKEGEEENTQAQHKDSTEQVAEEQ